MNLYVFLVLPSSRRHSKCGRPSTTIPSGWPAPKLSANRTVQPMKSSATATLSTIVPIMGLLECAVGWVALTKTSNYLHFLCFFRTSFPVEYKAREMKATDRPSSTFFGQLFGGRPDRWLCQTNRHLQKHPFVGLQQKDIGRSAGRANFVFLQRSLVERIRRGGRLSSSVHTDVSIVNALKGYTEKIIDRSIQVMGERGLLLPNKIKDIIFWTRLIFLL